MRSEPAPPTPGFESELEAVLRERITRRRRSRRPVPPRVLRQLRSLPALVAHGAAAVAVSAMLLLAFPAGTTRQVELPPVSEPPRTGYLSQFGVAVPSATERTITLAREAGFEVDVVTTYVPDRASHGEIVAMRHVTGPVTSVPVFEVARGPLLIVIGLTIGDAGTVAD